VKFIFHIPRKLFARTTAMSYYDAPALADDATHRKRAAVAQEMAAKTPPPVAQREEWPDLLRLPLMLGVLLIHAYDPLNGGALSLQGHDRVADMVMYLISQILARVSVPIFFYFSGFFFFRQLGSAGVTAWTHLIRKRIRTLLVPFMLWNLLTLLAFLAIYKFGHGMTHAGSVSDRVGSADLIGKIKLLFHHNGAPISYQFWFIRDLMICVLLSVLTIPMSQRWFGVLTAATGAAWLLELWPVAVPTAPSVFFFLLGGLAFRATGSLALNRMPRWIVLLYGAGVVAELFFGDMLGDVMHRLVLLLGVGSAYWLAALIGSHAVLRQFFMAHGATAFFLFAAHEPLLQMVKKLVFKFSLQSPGLLSILLAYIVPPVVVCILVLAAWHLLSRFSGGLLALMTGGR
jgi:hypothetical protein